MNYQKTISDSFAKLGYKPRAGQEQIVSDILTAFLTDKKRNVILSADTGIGKSIIAAVVSESLQIENEQETNSIILMHQNALSKQYASSFHHMGEDEYFQIKGAGNYQCNYFKSVHMKQDATGEDCVKQELSEMEREKYCKGCEYAKAKHYGRSTTNLITNYSYFFLMKLYMDPSTSKIRDLQIFDEAHTLNELFSDHMAIHFSTEKIDSYLKELSTHGNNKLDVEIAEFNSIKAAIISGSVKEHNYIDFCTRVLKNYSRVHTAFKRMSDLVPDMKDKMKFRKIGKKYSSLAAKIDDLIAYDYDHVFDDSTKNEIAIKSIFINDMIDKILGKYNLFMSATISVDFTEATYGLKPEETAFIEAAQVFPSENRPLLFLGKESLNYSKMQDPNVIIELQNKIKIITSHHSKEKGIILVPSFALARKLSEKISGVQLFEHKSGEKIESVIAKFKEYSGGAVLISPSIYEGLDFKGDDSRYQIIVKTPYASLGDKRIAYIADKYPDIYKELALLKIIQGIGRSIRSVEDKATTYFLDGSTKKLFDSRLNIWKKRFVIKS